MFDRQRKYAIRKIAIGTISAVIGSFMVGATDVSAKEVSVDYKYVTLNELTEDEKKLIKTNQHELVATEDKTYYMVYRPTSALPATSASKLADNMIGTGLAMGSVLLLAAVSVGKNRRKRLTSLIVLTTAGTSIIAPNAFAIENKELRRYNQELTLYSQADLPDPLRIDGYEFVGYIELDKEEATVETRVKEEIDLPSKPVATTRSVTQSLVKDVIDGATKVVTEAPVTKVVTEAPVTKVVTEAPVTKVVTETPTTKVVTEAPVTRVVTQQPAPIVISNDETTQVVTQAPVTQIVTETPVTRVVTEAPVTKVVTEAPVTRVITEAPVTKVVTEKPKETLVAEEKPTIIIETSKPKENLVIEEKPELKVVQGIEERIVEKQDIPFSTRYEEDANMWEGETKVVRPGTQGQKEIVDTYPTVNGLIVSNPSRTERVVKEATEQVEKRGTKQVQGQVEEVVTESITTQVEYVENTNAEAGEKSTVAEGKDGLKEIHNLYETIKDEKTKLISSSEKAVITSENKVIAVGVKPSVREEITAKAGVIYEEDKSMAVDSAPVTKQAGQDEKTRFVRTYLLDKKTGNVTANPETSEKTQTKQDMIVVVGTMPTTRTETRRYSIEYKSSDKLEVGQEQIEIPGKDGSVVYTTTYTLDKSTGKAIANPETKEVKEAVVNQVILVGTKPRVVTRTINYKMEDGSKAPESKVQTVEFTKDIVSTDSTTGLRTYSDWKTTNNEFVSVDSPTVAKYTADKKLVEKESVTADSTDKTVDVLYKVNIIETEDKKVVKRTINYLYEEDKSPVFDPFVQEVTYTRTKFTNEVTGEVKYGDWNIASQNIDEKISPEKDGYTVDIEKVDLLATTPDSKDEEVTVLYTDKFIEVKDVDTASLYFSLSGGEYTRVMALDTVPTDYSKYYVKVKSDQFKDLQLSVKSITEDTVNGQAVYKVVTTHPKLKQDENYNGYEEDYTIYVAKADASLQGVKTFRELLDKVKANPAENIVLANDISAEGFDVSLKDTAYITENFTGKLSGKNGDKNFAIYDLKLPLFSTLNKATIEDLALKNVDIDSNHYEVVAPLAKKAENGSVLRNVVVQGNIAASNNYGNYDSGDSGPARLVVGGIVGELAASTMTDSVFSGNINGDSTGIRYWDSTSRGRNTELVLGGLAGIVSGASQVLNNKVSSNIHINAVDGVGATNDPGRWVSDPMGNPLYAGTLVGLASAGTYANNYAEGNLVNQLDNQYTRYTDSIDRSHHTGIVGGLFGSVGRTTMRENTTAVAVTNGAVVSTSAVNGQNVVTGLASGDKTNPGTTSSVTLADVATSKDAIKKALEQSNQYITNEFDVDYTQVKGYQASHAQAYANMEKLLPFYNRAFIVKEANKLAASDNLVTKKLLSVTPMKDAVVVSDVSGDKDAINKLLLHFADSSVEYRDVAYKEEFKNTKIAEYKLTESGVAYTTDQFVNSYEAIVAAVKDDLSTVSYTGDEVWAALDTNVTKNETKIRELYLEERFEEVQANLEKVLKNVLGTSTAYANSNDVIDYIKKNKAELLLGLSYVSRWYNIDFNETNVQNLVTYQPDFFGKQVSTLEWLVEVGSAGYRALNPRVNDEKAASLVGENNNSENLHEILDSYRKVFASDKTMEEWYNSSVKAYVATGKAIDKDGNEIGNSDLYHQLNTRLASVIYLSGTSVDYSNAILPLLTARKDKIYIISTGASMQFGSLDAYVNRELKDTNQAEYNSELEKIKRAIDKVAHNQAKHWEAWHTVANENVEGRLVSNKPVWDTLFMKTATGKTWSDKFGENASEAIKDFFGPLGKHSATQPRSGQEGFSNGTEVYFTHANALTADGESIWTHEQVHNWDGGVYLGGNGRRSGAGMEAYAEGLLQAPRGRTRDALGINMYFDNTLENNPYPEYNSSPERFQSATDLQNFVKGMMDVLYVMDYAEAKSIMNLTPEQQVARLTKLTAIPRGTSVHKDDKFVSITADDLKNGLTTINDFIDSGLALSRYYGNNTVGETGGTDFYRSYVKVNMFTPFFGLAQNDTGVSGAYTFRRAAFEVLAEYGYQAFIDYASGKYKTDLEAVTAIFNGSHGNNLTDFKKDMFKQRIDRLTSLKPVTFSVGSKTYTINNSDDLMNTMNELVKAGNNNNIVNFKRAMYVAYMKDTNEFRTSIFTV